MDDDDLDATTRDALDALPADEPPPGFADRVLAARAGSTVAPPATRPRRRGLAAVAIAVVAAAAIALIVVPRLARDRSGQGARVAEARESISLSGRGVAVAEAGATIAWRVDDDGAAHVEQTRGDVFYRVEPGAPFEVHTPAGDVRVTGTCFRVEIQPMKPSRAALAGAALGATLAAVAVVTVYEGHVVVAGPDGETRSVSAGERASLGDTAPRTAAATAAALSPPPADATREELLARDATQRETVQQLTVRVAGLERELAGRPAGGAPVAERDPRNEDSDEGPYFDQPPEHLAQLAKKCALQYDMPPVDQGTPYVLEERDLAMLGVEPGEAEVINAALREMHARWLEMLRALYVEATGDLEASEALSPSALAQEIQDKAATGEIQRVRTRISRERAGLETPLADLSGTSPVERYFRAVIHLGDEFEALLAKSLGAERARALREANGGWPHRSIHSGCDDD